MILRRGGVASLRYSELQSLSDDVIIVRPSCKHNISLNRISLSQWVCMLRAARKMYVYYALER